MKAYMNLLDRVHPHLVAWIWSVILIVQLILAFFVFTDPQSYALWIAGWAIWFLGTAFALVPILTLRRKGRVPPGKSYMATTALVDTGIYAIVRHPQSGTAGILLNLALALLGQHWVVIALAVVGIGLSYVDTFNADQACIEKFGEVYLRYMQRVPRVNFIAGLWRLLVQRGREKMDR